MYTSWSVAHLFFHSAETITSHLSDKFKPIEFYEEANLGTQILSNIRRAHFEEPTPIQRYTIPCIREQHDIMACAQTGSGKTVRLTSIASISIVTHLNFLGGFSITNNIQST